PLPPPAPLPTWCHAELREVPLLAAPSNPDPLHAIDEPAARAPACTHSSPSVRTCQHVDAVEATRCSVWQCEAWLLVNCWQLRARCQRQTRGRPPRKAVLAASSCCARLKAMPRSRFRILACLRRYFSDGRGGSSGAANPRSAPCPGARAGPSAVGCGGRLPMRGCTGRPQLDSQVCVLVGELTQNDTTVGRWCGRPGRQLRCHVSIVAVVSVPCRPIADLGSEARQSQRISAPIRPTSPVNLGRRSLITLIQTFHCVDRKRGG